MSPLAEPVLAILVAEGSYMPLGAESLRKALAAMGSGAERVSLQARRDRVI